MRKYRIRRKNLVKGLLFTSPWLISLATFILYPIAASFYYSLCDYSVMKRPIFIGFGHYQDLIKDELFWKTLWNTLYYMILALPLILVFSLGLALLLNNPIRFRGIFRTIYFLPSLVPLVALGILWQWIFNGQYGVLNYGLSLLGIEGPSWLGSPAWSKPSIILASLWGVGGSIVIYLAALSDIPVQLYEAADIDGAGWWSKMINITIPMISPVIYFNLIMGIIIALQIFALPFVMTGGGPGSSSLFYAMYIYNTAFRYLRMGYASAMAWILFLLILTLTLLAVKFSSRLVYYSGR